MILLIRMSFKKVLSNLPTIMAGTLVILIASVLLVMGFFKYSSNYNDRKEIAKTRIGLVNNDTSKYADLAFGAFTSVKSVKNLVDLKMYPDEESALEALNDKKILAYAVMPDGFIDSVLSGENMPLKIYFGDLLPNSGAGFFFDIIDAGTSDISVSQSAIYAVDEAIYELDLSKEDQDKMMDEINDLYIDTFFDREDMYISKFQSSSIGLTLAEFYACTFIVLLITLSGLSFVSVLHQNKPSLLSTMKRKGIPLLTSLFNTLACSVIFTTAILVAWLVLRHRLLSIPSLFLIVFCLISFNSLIYRLFKDETIAMLTISIISFVLIFIAGGIFSISFMSNIIIDIGRYTHIGASFNLLKVIASKSNNITSNIVCLTYSVTMATLSIVLDYRKATRA